MVESKVQKKITDHLEGHGWLVIKIITANKPGWPDLVCIGPNGTILIEVKTERGKLSPLQVHRLEEISQVGGTAFVVYGWEDYLIKIQPYL